MWALCLYFLWILPEVHSQLTRSYTAFFLDTGDEGTTRDIALIGNPVSVQYTVGTETANASSWPAISTSMIQYTTGTTKEDDRVITITATLSSEQDLLSFRATAYGESGSDSFTIFENSELGKEYVVMTFCDVIGICQFAVAAIEKTNIEITLPRQRNFSNPTCNITYNDTVYFENDVIVEILGAGSVIQIQATCDLTGTLITADKPIAVFSGSHGNVIGWGNTKDFMMEQLLPMEYSGTEYVIHPYQNNTSGDVISITSYYNNTEIRIVGYGTYILSEDRQFIRKRIESDRPIKVWASKKVCVAQYIIDYEKEASAMIIVSPIEQYISQVVTNVEHQIQIVSESSQFKASDTITVNSTTSHELLNVTDVKKSKYVAGELIVSISNDFILSQDGGLQFSGYYVQESLPNHLMATSLGFQFQNQATVTKSHAPGDDFDNDGDGSLDEDSCNVDNWQEKEDCGKLLPVSQYGSFGSRFIIPLIHVDGEDFTFVSKIRLAIKSSETVNINYGVLNEQSVPSSCFDTEFYNYTNDIIDVSPEILQQTEIAIQVLVIGNTSEHSTAFVPFPIEVLGLEYFALTYCLNTTSCIHTCTVAAAYNDTQVIIQGQGTISLQENTTFTFNETTDLSGTYIKGTNPIAVTCGIVIPGSSVSQFQVPPIDTWGKTFRVVFQHSDSGVLRIIASDGNTVLTVVEYEYGQLETATIKELLINETYVYRGVYSLIDSGEFTDIDVEYQNAYHLDSNKPILVVFIPLKTPSSFVIVGSEYTSSQIRIGNESFSDCEEEQITGVRIEGNMFYLPYKLIGDNIKMSWWQKLNQPTSPTTISDQIPGDNTDNDGDGFVDEDYCGYLIDDIDEKSFLFDIDMDGAYNEDCRGCRMGQELRNFGCSSCQIGSYREAIGIDKCLSCSENFTTFYTGTSSSSECVDVCFEGFEYDHSNQSCKECELGYYKDTVSSEWTRYSFNNRWNCKVCPGSTTTLHKGSKISSDCVDNCVEGHGWTQYQQGGPSNCQPCLINWYKEISSADTTVPEDDRWICKECLNNKTTIGTGTINSGHCIEHCPEGEELEPYNPSGSCRSCSIGWYKSSSSSNLSLPQDERWRCNVCPDGTTTNETGVTDSATCYYYCAEGLEWKQYLVGGKADCQPCQIGWYKDLSGANTSLSEIDRWLCKQCPVNKTTIELGSNSPSLCIDHCDVGEELEPYNATGTCQRCQTGWFKNVSSEDTVIDNNDRWRCKECPQRKTTFETGTVDHEQCIEICEEGKELEPYNINGECQPCPVGWYKDYSSQDVNLPLDDRWRCKVCPDNKTTNETGVSDSALCYEYCAEGLEWKEYMTGGSMNCEPCQIGWYKDLSGVNTTLSEDDRWICKQCPYSKTTIHQGSNSSSLCIEQCIEGEELEPYEVSGTCQPCQIGWYKNVSSEDTSIDKDDRWRCSRCPDGETTFGTATVNIDQCVEHCPEGEELEPYNPSGSCRSCSIGWYKSSSSSNLSLPQDERWRCNVCPDGTTTNETGVTDSATCYYYCAEGLEWKQYLVGGKADCQPCQIGWYKDLSGANTSLFEIDRWLCKQCPVNKTTIELGSNSPSLCIDHCDVGEELEPYNATGTCQQCQTGWFKNVTSADTAIDKNDRWRCKECPHRKTTFGTGTVDHEQCIEICEEGKELEPYNINGECQPCPVGWYKDYSSQDVNLPLDDRWRCKVCPDNKTTNETGVSDSALCYEYCAEGLEWKGYMTGGSMNCEPCQIGWYKDLSGVNTTLSEDDRWICKQCPYSKTTIYQGSNSSSLCIEQCIEGEELEPYEVSGTCQPCQIGWYKNVSSEDTSIDKDDRWRCSRCPDGETTFGTGTVNIDQCVDNCLEGQELEPYSINGSCQPCQKGWYKDSSSEDVSLSPDDRWRCKICPGNKTTNQTGVSDSAMCYDYCIEGSEWKQYLVGGAVDCQPCQIGWYKDISGENTSISEADRWLCKQCPNNKTTINTGSDSSDLCIAHCTEGEELEPYDVIGTCQPCQIGWYKNISSEDTTNNINDRWRCERCPNGKTTFGTGTVNPERCFDVCFEGYEFDNASQTCKACKKGYYKEVSSLNLTVDLAVRWYCQPCPYGQTTNFTGTTERDHCRVCTCPCSRTASRSNLANMSSTEKAAILNELTQELKTDTKTLSSTVRKKTSASDNRPSSQAFGGIGIIMLTIPFTFLILIDIPTLKEHAQMFVRNVRAIIRGN